MTEIFNPNNDRVKRSIFNRLKLTKYIARSVTAIAISGGIGYGLLGHGHKYEPKVAADVMLPGALVLGAATFFERSSSFEQSDRWLKSIHRSRKQESSFLDSSNLMGSSNLKGPRNKDMMNAMLTFGEPVSGFLTGVFIFGDHSTTTADVLITSIAFGLDYLANSRTFNPVVSEFNQALNNPDINK